MATASVTLPRRIFNLKSFTARGVRRPPVLPLLLLGMFVFFAIFPGLVAHENPLRTDLGSHLLPPVWAADGSTSHLLGTDTIGRDIFSRLINGARIAMFIAFLGVIVAGAMGLVIGLFAGYFGKWVDVVAMRLVEITISTPLILVAFLLTAAIGPGIKNLIIVIGMFLWAGYARVIRAETLHVRENDYVTAARSIGASNLRIIFRHIFPNIAPTLIVLMTTQIGGLVLLEASLSFLGAGVPPPNPSWGSMVSGGRDVTVDAWWVAFFPGLAIMLLVLAFNLIGDWIRDVLDPKTQRL